MKRNMSTSEDEHNITSRNYRECSMSEIRNIVNWFVIPALVSGAVEDMVGAGHHHEIFLQAERHL